MPLLCIHCMLRALLNGQPVPKFEETVGEHLARVHPDLQAAQVERRQMERELEARFAAARDAHVN